jgi:hypothetical protein
LTDKNYKKRYFKILNDWNGNNLKAQIKHRKQLDKDIKENEKKEYKRLKRKYEKTIL